MPEPWLKLSTGLIANPKVMNLSPDLFRLWVCLLVEAKVFNEGGSLPAMARLGYSLHMQQSQLNGMVAALVNKGLVDRDGERLVMHDWSHWQAVKPSATKDAVRARVAKHRSVTTGNTPAGVTESVTPVTPKDKKRTEKTREEESNPPTPPSRGARIPQHWPFTDEMEQYALSKGVSKETAHEHQVEFHRHFLQTTRNPTSANWMLRWQNSLARDLREGRVKPDAVRSPLADEEAFIAPPVVETPAEIAYRKLREAGGDVPRWSEFIASFNKGGGADGV